MRENCLNEADDESNKENEIDNYKSQRSRNNIIGRFISNISSVAENHASNNLTNKFRSIIRAAYVYDYVGKIFMSKVVAV